MRDALVAEPMWCEACGGALPDGALWCDNPVVRNNAPPGAMADVLLPLDDDEGVPTEALSFVVREPVMHWDGGMWPGGTRPLYEVEPCGAWVDVFDLADERDEARHAAQAAIDACLVAQAVR